MMNQEAKPIIRATKETQQQLKIIAALTGETMQSVVARLVALEYEKQLAERGGKRDESQDV